MATTAERAGFAGKAGARAKATCTDAEAVDAKAAKVGAAEVGAAECTPERVKVRNVTPERHPSQDLAIMNPVDPQQQQISDKKADREIKGMPPADVTGAGAKATATAAGAKAAKAADAQAATCTYAQATADGEAKFKAEVIVDANLAKHKSPFVLAGVTNTHSTGPTTAARLSGSPTGCSTTQAYSAGCVCNMVTVAQSASCAEKNATAIADTCIKDADWTSSEPSKASKVIIVEVNELAYSAFVKAEVNEFESPSTALTKGLGASIAWQPADVSEIRDLSLSTLKNQIHLPRVAPPEVSNHRIHPPERREMLTYGDITEVSTSLKKSCQKPINFLESKVSSFQNSMNFKKS